MDMHRVAEHLAELQSKAQVYSSRSEKARRIRERYTIWHRQVTATRERRLASLLREEEFWRRAYRSELDRIDAVVYMIANVCGDHAASAVRDASYLLSSDGPYLTGKSRSDYGFILDYQKYAPDTILPRV